jgi:hypothetical protein
MKGRSKSETMDWTAYPTLPSSSSTHVVPLAEQEHAEDYVTQSKLSYLAPPRTIVLLNAAVHSGDSDLPVNPVLAGKRPRTASPELGGTSQPGCTRCHRASTVPEGRRLEAKGKERWKIEDDQ